MSLLSFIRLTLIFSFICPLCMSGQNWSSEEAIITSKGIQAAGLCLSKRYLLPSQNNSWCDGGRLLFPKKGGKGSLEHPQIQVLDEISREGRGNGTEIFLPLLSRVIFLFLPLLVYVQHQLQ